MTELRLVISRSAKADLVDIWEYIARDSERQADRFVDRLQETCALLAKNPAMGRTRDELRPGLRSHSLQRYLIFYRVQAQELQVVRILSGYRRVEDVL